MTAASYEGEASPPTVRPGTLRDILRRHPTAVAGGVLLLAIIAIAVFAPYLGTIDPQAISPIHRLRPPNSENWFGTDSVGRDIYSRVLYGARISLIVGFSVAVLSTVIGLVIGLTAGFSRVVDAIVMRIMDG